MADYDNAEVTQRERLAAQNQIALSKYNADTVRNQLAQQMANYDMSDKQNRRLADVQLTQNSRKTEADRFDAMRDLQNSALGLFGSMNQAMNGSTTGNTMYMLGNRADKDNMNYWTQHQVNQNAVENAYDESVNQNNLARNEAASTAEATIRNMEADLAANLNNINPNLYQAPGTGDTSLSWTGGSSGSSRSNIYSPESTGGALGNGSVSNGNSGSLNGVSGSTSTGNGGIYDSNKVEANMARLAGYLMPDNSAQAARELASRNRLMNNNYFNRLVNRYNGV